MRFSKFVLLIAIAVIAAAWGTPAARAAGGAISGRVTDENGNGLSGVQVLSHDGVTFRSTISVADGSYTLTNVPAGANHLQASLDGRPHAHYWGFTVSEGGTYANVNFTLRPGGGSVSGRVVDGSNIGVAGATVDVFEHTAQGYNNGAWARTSTDSAGYFATSTTNAPGTGLPTGTYLVQASKTGLPTASRDNVAVTASTNTPNIILLMASGNGSITGRVTNAANGAGVSGAQVLAEYGATQMSVSTDANGNYAINGLPTGGYNVVVLKSGFANAHRYSVMVTDGYTTSDVNFTLTTQVGRISGRVTDAGGQPIVGASILADSDQGTGYGFTTTDASGNYLLSNLALMYYYVHATASGYAGLVQLANVTNGQTTANINFTLGSAAGGISGRVTKAGQPAAYARLYAYSSQGSTQNYYKDGFADNDGNYTLADLPAGQYDVHVYDVPGYANQVRYFVAVGTNIVTGIDFNLTNGTSAIVGRVTDAAGSPLAGVKIQPFLAQNPGTWASVTTNSNGEYSASSLWAGPYNAYADLAGYPQVIKTSVPVANGTTTQINFVLGLPRALIATPADVSVTVYAGFGTYVNIHTDVTSGGTAMWTATTVATPPWLLLGASGNTQQVSGQTGQDLVLRFYPHEVAAGTYNTTVTLTASDAAPTTIQVRMIKLDMPNKVFMPLVIR